MNDKYYNGNYSPYQTQHSLKQVTNDQMCYSYSNFSVNALSPITHFTDVCNLSSQNFNYQPNGAVQQEQSVSDVFMWEGRIIPDVERIPDKLDMIEISNKELSPASFCGNSDLIVSDPYKHNTSKNLPSFNRYENEWCYSQSSCSQRGSYTSCSQGKGTANVHFMSKNCNYSDVYHENSNMFSSFNNKNLQNEAVPDYTYNYCENKFMESQLFIQNDSYAGMTTNTPFSPIINPIDQQTEGSNEESDIIVEESDEEVTDYSDDHEKRSVDPTNKCLICNIVYKPLGTQFYFLTAENPLTMSSQKPVVEKLVSIIGQISTTRNYLCSECLEFINHIDHLQLKLEIYKSDIVAKFKRTCLENKIQCGEKFSTQKMSRNNKLPRYKCKLCKKILCLKKYCLYHLKKHKCRGYLCELCGRIFSNKKKFSLHSFRHKNEKQQKIEGFNCKNCNKIFRTKSNQKEHENYCLSILPFKCLHDRCDKKFPSASKLKNHVRLKHDKKFIVICSICNIGFIKISDYKSHMISHSADKKYSCSKCDKSYKTLSNLNFHMKIHSPKLPFNCHVCKKGFTRKDYLEVHINNHNGVKNFSCNICEKKFVSQKNLDAHLKYHEETVKKSTCNICGKTMTSGFEEHLRIHNNLREFECEHCDMRFNTKGTLSKHVKKKHS